MKEKNYTIINDCIYGQIKVEFPFNKIIECEDFLRLKEIKQNGYSYLAKGREGLKDDNRYSHSIGVFYLIGKAIEHIENQLNNYGIKVSEEDKKIAKTAMLLHDLGHGPCSHLAEKVTKYPHEQRTVDFILQDTPLNAMLKKYFGEKSILKIAKFISKENQEINKRIPRDSSSLFIVLKSLIANQVDVDRIDYTLRDSYYAGIKSGVDYNEIIKSFIVTINSNNEMEIVVQRDNLRYIEQLLFERFENYRDIYHSKEAKIRDELFKIIVNRIKKIYKDNIVSLDTEAMPSSEIKPALIKFNQRAKDKIVLTDNFTQLVFSPKNLDLKVYKTLTDKIIETT